MTSASALKETQIAVRTRLANDATLMNIRGITGIFDEAPSDQPYPYISLGTKVEIPWINKTFGREEKQVTLVLDAWTDLNSGDVHLDILDDINRLFNDPVDTNSNPWPLSLSSYTNTQCIVEWSTTMIDESDQCRHTIARLFVTNT